VYYGKDYELYKSYQNGSIDLKNYYLTVILKVLIITILIGVIYFGYIYLSNLTKTLKSNSQTNPIQPQCVTQLTPDDITKIVTLVVERIQQKREKRKLDDNDYSKELLKYTINSNREQNIEGIDIYLKAKKRKDEFQMQRENGNRILIEKGEKLFSIPLDDTLQKDDYTKSIEKELETRKREMKVIVVRRGDSLSKIAKRAYGDPNAYIKIIKANPHILKNPNLIYVGQRLRIP